MTYPTRRTLRRRFASLIVCGLSLLGMNAASARVETSAWQTECLGYYSLALPGDFEYALVQMPVPTALRDYSFEFRHVIGAWNTAINVDTDGSVDHNDIYITADAKPGDLQKLLDAKNKEQQKVKEEYLARATRLDGRPESAKDIDPDGEHRKALRQSAAQIPFYEVFAKDRAFGMGGDTNTTLFMLIDGHIVNAYRKTVGSPARTVDAFLTHYKPRALFETPSGAGVCVPHGFITGEKKPARIALSLRLKDQPDIVVFLDAHDASEGTEDAKRFVNDKAPRSYFVGAEFTEPLDGDLKPYRSITIDGRKGVGAFARITRSTSVRPDQAVNNEQNKNQDWGYLAYIPGQPGGRPGESFNLVFKVERFGRFAKQPMSEKQFRALVKTLAAGIKRRPGAWVPQ